MPTFPGPPVSTQARQQSSNIPEARNLEVAQTRVTTHPVPPPRDYVGAQLKRRGQAILNVAAEIDEASQDRDKFNAQTGYLDFANAQRRATDEDSEALDGPDAPAFESNQMQRFDAQARDFFATVPDSQKAAVDTKLRQLRNTISNAAYARGRTVGQKYHSDQVTTQVENAGVAVSQDPFTLETQVQNLSELINAADMTPAKKRAEISAMRSQLAAQAISGFVEQGRFGEALQLRDQYVKAAADKGYGVSVEGGAVVDRIIEAESGGRRTATNPRSTATGLGQFIESTWISMMQKYHPELTRGRSRSDILDYRTDAALSREMTAKYAEENAAVLRNAGLEPTAANVYLAHFLGPGAKSGGAVQVLQHTDDTPLETVIPSRKMNANPHLKGRTVGWLRNWASQKMGTGLATRNVEIGPAWLAKVDKRIDAARSKAVQDLSSATRDQIERQILLDPTSVPEEAVINNPLLTTAHGNDLIESLRSELKKTASLNTARLKFGFGEDASSTFNPYDSDDRKQRDMLSVDPDTLPEIPPNGEGAVERELELTRRTGMANTDVANSVRHGLNSPDVGEFTSALGMAYETLNASSRAFNGRDGFGKVRDYVDEYKAFRKVGYSHENAAQAVHQMQHPEGRGNTTQLKATAKGILKEAEFSPANVVSMVADGTFSNPDIALEEVMGPGIVADYKRIWEERYVASGGNRAFADESTRQQMRKMYSNSPLAGDSLFHSDFVKYPFEKIPAYEPIDNSYDAYRKDAAKLASKALDREVHPDNVMIIADPTVTGADIMSGEDRPRFSIWYKSEVNGYETASMLPDHYRPDPGALQKASAAAKVAERQRRERIESAPNGITVGINKDGNEVLVNAVTREVMQDVDGVVTGTGEQYVPPETIPVTRGHHKVNPETEIVQARGRGRRVVTADHYEDLRASNTAYQARKKRLSKEKRTIDSMINDDFLPVSP